MRARNPVLAGQISAIATDPPPVRPLLSGVCSPDQSLPVTAIAEQGGFFLAVEGVSNGLDCARPGTTKYAVGLKGFLKAILCRCSRSLDLPVVCANKVLGDSLSADRASLAGHPVEDTHEGRTEDAIASGLRLRCEVQESRGAGMLKLFKIPGTFLGPEAGRFE